MKTMMLIAAMMLCSMSGRVFAMGGIAETVPGASVAAGNTVIISLTISQIPEAELPTRDAQTFFQERVRARLPNYTNNFSNFVPIQNYDQIPSGDLIPLNTYELVFRDIEQSPDSLTNDTTDLSFIFTVELRDITGNSFKDILDASENIRVDFYILESGTNDIDNNINSAEITIATDNIVVAEAPSGVSASAGDGSASVRWSNPSSNVDFYNVESQAIESDRSVPGGVTILLFERGSGDFPLDGFLANGTETTDDATCTTAMYSDSATDGAGCLVPCSEDASSDPKITYLDIAGIRTSSDFLNGSIQINSEGVSEESVTFMNLTNAQQYRAVVVYEPNQINIQDARCVTVTPEEQFSIQGKFAGSSKKDTTKLPCMITQASAGEWGQQELDLFRFVRDGLFVKAESQLHLVSSYYSASATLEQPLKQSGFLRGMVYGIFEPIASLLSWVY